MAFTQKHMNIILILGVLATLAIVLCRSSGNENFFNAANNKGVCYQPVAQQTAQQVAQQAAQQAVQQVAQQQAQQVALQAVQQVAQQQVAQQVAQQQAQQVSQQAVQQVAQQQAQQVAQQVAQQQAQQAVQQVAIQQQAVQGVNEKLQGAPILPEINYPKNNIPRNDSNYHVQGQQIKYGGMGFSINGLETHHMNEQHKCAITRSVFGNLNKNGYMTDDQVPQTFNKLYKSDCGSW